MPDRSTRCRPACASSHAGGRTAWVTSPTSCSCRRSERERGGYPGEERATHEEGHEMSEHDTATEDVRMMDYFMHLEYHELVCPIVLRYAEALKEGKLL